MSKRRKKIARCRGSVMLPVWGWLCILFVYTPISLLVLGLFRGLMPEEWTLSVWLGLCCFVIGGYFLGLFVLIAIPMITESLEVVANRAGLSVFQIWKGANIREKIARELARVLLLVAASLIGFAVLPSLDFLSDTSIAIKWGAATQVAVIALLLLFAALKEKMPRLGGFTGEMRCRGLIPR